MIQKDRYVVPIVTPRELGMDERSCICGHPRWKHYNGNLTTSPQADGHCREQACQCSQFCIKQKEAEG